MTKSRQWNLILYNFPFNHSNTYTRAQRNERREREQRELVKKLREEHENLSDLIYEDYRSGSDSFSSSDNLQEARTKWHSAEDVRNRKVSYSFLCC